MQSSPVVTQATFSPMYVSQGNSQDVTITAVGTEENPITSVTGMAIPDDQSIFVALALDTGTDVEGIWIGFWIMLSDATYCPTYGFNINVTSALGTQTVELNFR